MRRCVLLPSFVVVGLGLAATPQARADRVHLKNGRVVEGDVREEGDAVVVRTRAGAEARLPRDQVVRIEEDATPEERARERLAALADDDLEAHLALARDGERAGLDAVVREVRDRILARWPDEPETRRALGWVKHEGRWITRADYMAGLGLVPGDDGRTWITPEEAARRTDEERARALAPELRRLLAGGSSGRPEDVAPIRSRIATYDDLAAVPVLEEHVTTDSVAVRLLAVEELGRRKAASARPRLGRAAIEDPRRAVRGAALHALQQMPIDPGMTGYFEKALGRDHAFQRVHAVEALGVFPGPRTVPVLITTLRESTTGFGRCHITIETQRAYIQDFELSSGGTGTILAEVADPIVGTSVEGTSLDARVVQWERTAIVTTLRKITGQTFGADPDAWRRWFGEGR